MRNMEECVFSEKRPWEIFLKSRNQIVTWMKEEMNFDDEEISGAISLSEDELYEIRNPKENHELDKN